VDTDSDDGDDLLVVRNEGELGLAPDEDDSFLHSIDEEQAIDDDHDELPSLDSKHMPLAEQAEIGLKEILAQFKLPDHVEEATLGTFQGFITSAAHDLSIHAIPSDNRFPWAMLTRRDDGWGVLADIALRIDAHV
jgi:hypothetical protein